MKKHLANYNLISFCFFQLFFTQTLHAGDLSSKLPAASTTELCPTLLPVLIEQKPNRARRRGTKRLPIVPKSFQITSQMQNWYDSAMKAINRYGACGGGRQCITLTDKIEALEARIKSLVGHPEGNAIRELRDAVTALKNLEREAEGMYRDFRTANQRRDFPYGFESREEYEAFGRQFTHILRERLGHPGSQQIEAWLGGSATDGLSYIEKSSGVLRKPFGEDSDLDMWVVVPERTFNQLFKGQLASEFVESPGVSFAIDIGRLQTSLSSNLQLDTNLRSLPYFLEQQGQLIGGRKISIKFSTQAPPQSEVNYLKLLK